MTHQILVVVRQDNVYDFKELNEYLKEGWVVVSATPLIGYAFATSSHTLGEVHYILTHVHS